MPRRQVVLGIVGAVVLAAAGGCGGDDDEGGGGGGGAQGGGSAPAEQAVNAKELFTNTCGGCHTLADAGTDGTVGPNLDDLGPSREQVLTALRTGPGAMPENVLVGEEAQAVADYVSTSAGQ